VYVEYVDVDTKPCMVFNGKSVALRGHCSISESVYAESTVQTGWQETRTDDTNHIH